MLTFQEIIRRLSQFWEEQGCIIHQGYDLEVGAGTFNPATFLRCFGPEPYQAAYVEPCRRPADGRYGTNPNRLQHYFQYQVILKPSPANILDLYLKSLESVGFNLAEHDMRFVHDDWESPTLGAWGLGWEVWMDGMEVTQFTYFQSVGGQPLKPVTGEITYGLERLAMYIQNVNSIFDIQWNDKLTYGDIYHRNEVEWSHYNFEGASTAMWFRHFNDYEQEAKAMMAAGLPIPAYDFVMKASHAFNLLDARGAISVTERTGYIGRIRDLAKQIAESYIKSREDQGHPLLKYSPQREVAAPVPSLSPALSQAKPGQKAPFLLEIGTEELPATFVPIGIKNLEQAIKTLLTKESITFKSMRAVGAPRRLALMAEEMDLATAPQTQEKRGPAVSQAFDAQGNATPAAEGFFRSIGIQTPTLQKIREGLFENVVVRPIKEVEYVFANVTTPGKTVASILAEALPTLILNLDFPKKMHWGDLDISYPRPLRWLVCLLGEEVVPFSIANITSGRESRGHFQLHNKPLSISTASDYLEILRRSFVLVDQEERRKSILKQLDALEEQIKGKIIERDRVLAEVINLSEWPQLTSASYDAAFLKAPKEVLISEMVEHQRYFPVVEQDGQLKNLFVITADNNPSDQIRAGNQRVLSARLSDGVFLYQQGLKVPLEQFNEKLKVVTFQKSLGSMHDKVMRLVQHINVLQKELKISSASKALRAAELSKADLVSEMVYEFPDLQGIIGKYYAQAHGEDPEVAVALEEQWMPKGENAPLPTSETGTLLSLADKLDNLVGCFCAGLRPTSSSDPYALRRQTLGIIKILIQGRYHLPMKSTLRACLQHFPKNLVTEPDTLISEIEAFILNRIKTVFLDYGFSRDEIEAGLSQGFSDIYDAFAKVQALHSFRGHEKFPLLLEVYKRAKGQIGSAQSLAFTPSLLKENAERSLDSQLNTAEQTFMQAIEHKQYDQAYGLIAQIQPALATLFDEVKILADDPAIRDNRIALLQRVFSLFGQLLDFSKIQS